MVLSFGVLSLVGSIAFCVDDLFNPKIETNPNIIAQATGINVLLTSKFSALSQNQITRIQQLFTEIENIILGKAPTVVVAPTPVVESMCGTADPMDLQVAFNKIKAVAYAEKGLNYSTERARDFARLWIDKYPCSRADSYVTDLVRLVNFAFDGDLLNLGAAEASSYALSQVDSFCSKSAENFELEFQQAYEFAFSAQGLNYATSDAFKYAKDRIEKKYFKCGGAPKL